MTIPRLSNTISKAISWCYGGLLVVCIVLIEWNNGKLVGEVKQLKKQQAELEDQLFLCRYNAEIGQELFDRSMAYTGWPVVSESVYWGTDSLHLFSLTRFARTPRLFFCFSDYTCVPCVDGAVELVKKTFPEYVSDERIVFTGDQAPRLRNDCYGKKMMSNIALPLREIGSPFFFVLDENKQLSRLHIFNKLAPDKTAVYLEEIRKMF